MMMIWLFSFKADMTMKARLVVNGKMCKPGLDYNPDETYCGNVAATSIKVIFALSALYELTLQGGDLIGAYLVTTGSKGNTRWNNCTKRNGTTGTRKPLWFTVFWKKFQ